MSETGGDGLSEEQLAELRRVLTHQELERTQLRVAPESTKMMSRGGWIGRALLFILSTVALGAIATAVFLVSYAKFWLLVGIFVFVAIIYTVARARWQAFKIVTHTLPRRPTASATAGSEIHGYAFFVVLFCIASVGIGVPLSYSVLDPPFNMPAANHVTTVPRACREPELRFEERTIGFDQLLLCSNAAPHHIATLRAQALGWVISYVDAGTSHDTLGAELVGLRGAFFSPFFTSTMDAAPSPFGTIVRWHVPHDDEIGFEYVRPPYDAGAPLLLKYLSFTRWPWLMIAIVSAVIMCIWTAVVLPALAGRLAPVFSRGKHESS